MSSGEFSSIMQSAIDAATARIEGTSNAVSEDTAPPAAESATGERQDSETQVEQPAETPASKVQTFKIKGRDLTEEQIEEAIVTHSNFEKRRAKQERQSQELAQAKRDQDAEYAKKLAELDKRLASLQESNNGGDNEEDEDSRLVDSIAAMVVQRLEGKIREREDHAAMQRRSEEVQKDFEFRLENTAKEYGISSDALFRRFMSMDKPVLSLDDAAMEVRRASKSVSGKGAGQQKPPAPPAAHPGGPSVARILSPTISPDKIPELGTPEFEKFAEQHARGILAAANG